MKIILDDALDNKLGDELKTYLLEQIGITDVNFNVTDKSFITELNIKFNNQTSPIIIMKYIDLFQKYDYPIILEFDKENDGIYKKLKYMVEDMCCEYCYKGFVKELYENNNIKSVKSNFEFDKPAFNIEFIIEYNENCNKQEIIKYIKDKLNY